VFIVPVVSFVIDSVQKFWTHARISLLICAKQRMTMKQQH